MKKFSINPAFTLAEVMITLGIIGVVAVFTMPVLLSDVSERVNSNRQANIAQKVTKAVELMIVNGDYEQFETTEEFTDKLQKYLKIVKRCNSNNLTQCWPSEKVTTSDGNKYTVANAKTGKNLHTISPTNNVGLVLADGGNIILTYNPDATIPNSDAGFTQTKKNLPIGGGKFKEFAYTSNATNAIDFVMDVNGSTGPNAESDNDGNYYDIRSFKIASFSTAGCPGYKFNGVCVYDIGTDYTSLPCTENSNNSTYCGTLSGYMTDYLAGAKKACAEFGMVIPEYEDLKTILSSPENTHKNEHNGSYRSNRRQTQHYTWNVVSSNPTGNAPGVYNYTKCPVICIMK